MIRINLLPHREMRRERRKREFVSTMVITAIAGAVLAFAGGFVINQRIEYQESRNQYIKSAIQKLDVEIAEIKTLEEAIAALKARQKAVEDLQSDRTVPVHLFDELVKLMPEGVFIEKLNQVDMRVSLNGFAQSNERVAELLRNLSDRSDWMERPQLDEIKEVAIKEPIPTSKAGEVRRAYEFKMNVLIKRRNVEGQGGAQPGQPKRADLDVQRAGPDAPRADSRTAALVYSAAAAAVAGQGSAR
ncbi:MAG: PilN domain-containing protein [Lautropia sp.]